MIKQIHSLILGIGGKMIAISLWLCISIVIFIYPTSNFFWYFEALDVLIILTCIAVIPILRSIKQKNKVVGHKNINLSAVIQIVSFAFMLFMIGFINLDEFFSFHIYLSSSINDALVLWIVLKIGLNTFLMFITAKYVRFLTI